MLPSVIGDIASSFAGAAPPSSGFSDTFHDTNGTNLTAHTMNSGLGWGITSGTWTINSNVLKQTVNDGTNREAYSDAQAANVTNTLVATTPSTGQYWLGAVIRFIDDNNYWRCGLDTAGPVLYLQEDTGGTRTTRASTSASVTAPNNTSITTVLAASGNSITVTSSAGGSLSFSSSSHNTATLCGITAYDDGSYTSPAYTSITVTSP